MSGEFPVTIDAQLSEDQDAVFSFTGSWSQTDLPTLSAGGVELEPTLRSGQLRWRWSPDFHAGEVVLTLRHGGAEDSLVVEVNPNQAKLTRADYAALTARL